MSATNATPILNLPLFLGTDKPAWLTDWNGAMNTIDTAIAALQTAEAGTATSLATLAQSVTALSGTVEQHTTALQTVTEATAGNTSSINTINSLIGNGTPTTTDQTIIGAINELNAGKAANSDVTKVVATVTADGVKTFSQLLTELFTGVASLSPKAEVVVGNAVFHCMNVNDKVFASSYSAASGISISTLNASVFRNVSIADGGTLTVNDRSANVADNGEVIKLYN